MIKSDKIYYCSACLSLAIKEESGIKYCSKCGCANLKFNTIEKWEQAMYDKYPRNMVLHPRGIFVDTYVRNDYYKKN